MFALWCVCICGGIAARDSSNAKRFNDLHNEARVSRGAGSRRGTNMEKRVVSRDVPAATAATALST